PEGLMKFAKLVVALAVILFSFSTLSQTHPPDEQDYNTPLNGGNQYCVPPYGYTWACGYSCNTTDGLCRCQQNDNPTSICMKSQAGTGCGCFEHACDNCCS